MNKPNAESGFSLIEMSMVLAIIGLLMGGGLLAITTVLERNKRTQTFQSLDKIEEALTLYVIRYTRLPCPASGTAGTGLSDPTGSGACTEPNANTGIVPWRTLGIEQALARDGWGNMISYAVSNLTTDNNMLRSGTTYPAGTLIVNNAAGAEVTPGATDRAAYVLISHGKNGAGACCAAGGGTKTGSPAAVASGAEAENNDGDTTFVQNDPIQVTATYFDDIVRWRTAAYIVQACGTGACGN